MTKRSVLIVNTGSSSVKWVVLDAQTEAIEQQGGASWQDTDVGRHARELKSALDGVLPVDAVGHRVVHGGIRFREAVLVDETVRHEIARLAELAPLHNPAALAGIDAARDRFPDVPQVAAFDTAFHASLPSAAATYALPSEWTTRWGLRRFGFHGLSVSYAIERVRELSGGLPRRVVVCHLGAGCSVTAVADSRSMDTSMGFTPLEGLMMARRSGSVDPGLLLYLLDRAGMSAADVDKGLNDDSGLLGVSGVSADMREVLAAADNGNEQAQLAIDMFVRRVVSTVGGQIAILGGLDKLVFTGGIGEHSAAIRAAICDALAYLGLKLDATVNSSVQTDADIAAAGSTARVFVITAREDLAILAQLKRVLAWDSSSYA